MKVAFTGHREYDSEQYDAALEQRILALCRDSVERGVQLTFLSGMAVGFDMAAAEMVCAIRERYGFDNVLLHAVVPYAMQAEFYSEDNLARYQILLDKADNVVVLEESYNQFVFFKRNDYLVENATQMIAYFDGVNKGGTAYTVRRARKEKLPTENIFQQSQLSLF
ncbi:MAG: SLOG family protein [Rikenellaceae bacterium]